MADQQKTTSEDEQPPADTPAKIQVLEDSALAEQLMERLTIANDEDEYREVRDQIWAIGENAIPVLRKGLTSRSPRQRMAAACNLGRLSDYNSLRDLVNLLRDPASRVREMALFGLGVMGQPRAIEYILECASDYDPDVRYRVLVALKDLQYKDIETVLIRALKDDAYSVREQAMMTLRDVATPQSMPFLLLVLMEPEVKLQGMAETTLDRILPQCLEKHYLALREHVTPRQARLVMNYLEGRNLHEVWPALHNHLSARLGRRSKAPRLDKYGRILTDENDVEELYHAFGRDDTVEMMLDHVLHSESSKSVLLVGEAGVGKTAVIHEFTRRLIKADDTYTVLESNTSELMTGTRYLGDWETKLKEMTDLLIEHGNVILYLTNPDDLLGAGAHSKSNESFADFFKPYLQRGELIMIAETTPDLIKTGLSRDPGFLRTFQQIRLDAMTDKETVDVLTERLEVVQGRNDRPVHAERDVLEDIADFARSFVTRSKAPGRACDLMDTVVEFVGRSQDPKAPKTQPITLVHTDIPNALAESTGLRLELLDDTRPLDLDAWRAWFTERLIAQDQAVDVMLDRLTLVKSWLRDPERPIGTLFLVGPTGVGKTYFAKLVAEKLFGDADRMIRFDLSEYQGRYAVEKLVGSPHDKDREGLLTEAIRQQPYCVLLLDEFEKADPDVFHLFLQVLDEGRLTDARGKTTDFRQCIIMMTSNLGASRMSPTPLGFNQAGKRKLAGSVQRRMEEVFQPEFLNRLDNIVVFDPLEEDSIFKLVDLHIKRVTERRGFKRSGITLNLHPEARQWLATHGFSARFGARELHRCVERQLLTRLSSTLARHGALPEGTIAHVEVDSKTNTLSIHLQKPVSPKSTSPDSHSLTPEPTTPTKSSSPDLDPSPTPDPVHPEATIAKVSD